VESGWLGSQCCECTCAPGRQWRAKGRGQLEQALAVYLLQEMVEVSIDVPCFLRGRTTYGGDAEMSDLHKAQNPSF
jgi:hypothetical protein